MGDPDNEMTTYSFGTAEGGKCLLSWMGIRDEWQLIDSEVAGMDGWLDGGTAKLLVALGCGWTCGFMSCWSWMT